MLYMNFAIWMESSEDFGLAIFGVEVNNYYLQKQLTC